MVYHWHKHLVTSMRTVVCIGGGRFGSRAAAEARDRGDRVLVVDNDEHCRARAISSSATDRGAVLQAGREEILFLRGDGVGTLADILTEWTPDVIVPAARGHLAALVAVEWVRRHGRKVVPTPERVAALTDGLPPRSVCLVDERNGILATSFMNEGACADGCSQPALCPVTGRRNEVAMSELIAAALKRSSDRSVVLVTSGAVGGISGSELSAMLSLLDEAEEGDIVGIATACRCHGVINLLRIG